MRYARLFFLGITVIFGGGAEAAVSSFPGRNGAIAFVRFSSDGGRLFVMGPNGRHQVPLFGSDREGAEPSWSPDGRRLAYVTFSEEGASTLHVGDFATGATEELLTQPATATRASISNPAWSPDGTQILFTRFQQPFQYELHVIGVRGRRERKVTAGYFGTWSPDGRKIAFVGRRDPADSPKLYVSRPDGSGRRLVADRASEPDWSPDGHRIAFVRTHDNQTEVYVMNADGSRQRRLTHIAAHDLNPTWSPDGRKIAFSSNRDGSFEIYVMNVDGSRQTRLTRNLVDDQEPAWRALLRAP